MKIVNAIDGLEYELGDEFKGASSFYRIKALREEGLLKASILVENRDSGEEWWAPLIVRYLHPEFMFQKVGFIPT